MLLDLFNAQIDLRVMQLAIKDEGWITDEFVTGLVSGQREYTLPEGAGRVKQVVLTYTLGGRVFERTLDRNDQWTGTVVHGVGPNGVVGYLPTYRLKGELLLLEPRPQFTLADSLRIDLESAPARLVADADKIDLRFPDLMETLLIYDSACAALAQEQTQGNFPESYVNHLLKIRTDLDEVFQEYTTDRTEGRVFGPAFRQGG